MAANHKNLRCVTQLGQGRDQILNRPHAKTTRREQDGCFLQVQTVLAAHCRFFLPHREYWINRNAADGDLCAGNPKLIQVDTRLLERDEVVFVVMAQPHGVNNEVSYNNSLCATESPFRFETRNNLSR